MEQEQIEENVQADDMDTDPNQEEEPQVKIFQTSNFEQSIELKTYFNKIVRDPFNNFCIDCKQNKTSHAIIWLGAYVCGECATKILKAHGG